MGAPPAGGTQVVVQGRGFQAGATVTFGGVAATGVTLDPVTGFVTVTTPPHAPGFVDVVLGNPDGQLSTLSLFNYGPPPVVTGVAPLVVGGGKPITITGSDFSANAGLGVTVGGSPSVFGILSKTATQIVALVPKLPPGTYPVVVVNFDGQTGTAPMPITIN